jgi:subtilisin family serine protease
LFDVSKLVQFGYDDRSRSDLPLLVKAAGGGSARSAATVVAGAAVRVSRELPRVGAVALREDKAAAGKFWERVRGGVPAGRAASGLAGGLERVWLDGPVRAALDQSVPQIGAPAAWRAGRTGAGVTVGVLDTGVDATHPDLAGAVADAVDFTDSPSGTRDLVGHGTHVASIITGSGTASGGRYRGVAPDARLLVGKVLGDDGFGSESWVLAGMEWAAGRTRVVNMSLGDPWPSDGTDVLSQAVNRLTAQSGTLFVVAAGNTGPSAESIGSPAAADAALTVGAVSKQDELAEFSSRGPRWMDQAIKPDLTAPGVDIVAARATGTTIGAPVGDSYTRLSGTSMATPHAAGAAAILAGQHPGWTAERLKSALMGSATPAADRTVYEQGAGRVDVARATTQAVTATPTNLSEGIVRWPHSDDRPIARTVTYHNDGNSDTTLRLGLDVRDPAGEPAPSGMFSLTGPQVIVPAHGTATATLTTNTTVSGPDGLYGGVLTAASADGQTRVRIPIGVTREVESYNITLSFLDHHGLPAPEYFFRFVDLKRPKAYLSYDPSGTVVARVPRGRYFLDGWVQTFNQNESIDTTVVTEPQVEVSADTTMTFDARDGRPLGLLVDQPAARPGFTLLDFAMTTPWGGTGSFWAQPDFKGLLVRPSRTAAPPGQFTFLVEGVLAEPDGVGGFAGSPYQYHVHWTADRAVPTTLVRRFCDRDLAKARALLAATAPGRTGVKDGVASGPLPSVLIEFYTPGQPWFGSLDTINPEHNSESFIAGLGRTFSPGNLAAQQWNAAVFGPAFPYQANAPADWAGRLGDLMRFDLPLFTDQAVDHFGYSQTDTGDTVLYRDGQRVDSSGVPGSGDFTVPAGPASYRLQTEATRSVSPLSTRVSAAWTFHSDTIPGQDPQPIPLLAVRFAPPLDSHNRAPTGSTFTFPVYVQRNGTQTATVATLAVQVSYDDGHTWTPVPLTGSGDQRTATVAHPRGGSFVSLRATASDPAGNSVQQTIIHAYELKR